MTAVDKGDGDTGAYLLTPSPCDNERSNRDVGADGRTGCKRPRGL